MDLCKSTLSAPRQKLLQDMRRNPFSTIEIVIRDGEPCFCPPPKITREIKLGVEASPCGVTEADWMKKRSVIDLFEHIDRIPSESIITIETRHGLPFRLILRGEV